MKELRQYWDQFLNSKIAKEYNKEVTMFEKWLRRMGEAINAESERGRR